MREEDIHKHFQHIFTLNMEEIQRHNEQILNFAKNPLPGVSVLPLGVKPPQIAIVNAFSKKSELAQSAACLTYMFIRLAGKISTANFERSENHKKLKAITVKMLVDGQEILVDCDKIQASELGQSHSKRNPISKMSDIGNQMEMALEETKNKLIGGLSFPLNPILDLVFQSFYLILPTNQEKPEDRQKNIKDILREASKFKF